MSDTQSEILELVQVLWRKVQKDEAKLKEDLQTCKANFARSMSNAITEYERHDPSMAVSAHIRGCEWIVTRSNSDRKILQEKLQQHIALLEKIHRALESQGNPRKASLVLLDSRELRFFLQRYDAEMNVLESLLLQSSLHRIASFQDEQTREQIWKEHQARFGDHIQPSQTLKPATVITPKLTDCQSRLSNLPPEILAAIFNACDLETCISLREVDSAWYLLFQRSDSALRQKMAVRNPWIKPGDDLRTWRDCVLVFVTRLKTWKSAKHLDNIKIPRKKVPRKTVVAFRLGRDEKLSPNYSIMADSHSCPYSCQHLHFYAEDPEHCFTRDPWTLETANESDSNAVVYIDGDKTIIKGEGDVCVTLPTASIRPEHISSPSPLEETESYLMVKLKNGKRYAMPRDKPHFDYGIEITLDHNLDVSEVGGILVCGNMNTSTEFFLADFESRTLKRYAAKGEFWLEAFYNGLIWVKKFRDVMIPTFVDLKDPQKVYYSATKAISAVSVADARQCSRSRASQFVVGVGLYANETGIVDLARGIVTIVQPPHTGFDDEERATFVGWLNGHSQARMMHPHDVPDIEKEVFQKYGVPEEDW